jgi:transposase
MTKTEIIKQLMKISNRQLAEAHDLEPLMGDSFSREAIERLANETTNAIAELILKIKNGH